VTPVDARLAELERHYDLPASTAPALRRLLDVVATDPHAPTTVTEPGVAVDIHVADSLAGLGVPEVREASRLADLGAGAGFPGLVLAAALPATRVTLVESVARKCAFLERAATVAGLPNVDVVAARAEAWRDGLGSCDVVTARALAPLGVLAEYAAPLLRSGGVLVAYKGARDPGEEAGGARAAGVLGLEARPPVAVEGIPGVLHRHLYVYSKVRETPPRFPRRPGMARKRPL
jgi:16S rRNA (guanine527-N7)-methyltransferase